MIVNKLKDIHSITGSLCTLENTQSEQTI